MRKITDEGFLFLYGAGLLVTAETGIPAVITILFACIYTCVNLVGEEKYLHYIMTIAFVAAGIVFKEMWMFLPAVLYNMLCFYSLVYIGGSRYDRCLCRAGIPGILRAGKRRCLLLPGWQQQFCYMDGPGG